MLCPSTLHPADRIPGASVYGFMPGGVRIAFCSACAEKAIDTGALIPDRKIDR